MATLGNTPNLNAAVNYLERIDDLGPGSSGFGLDGAQSALPYLIADADLDNSIIDILGYTNPNAGYALGTSPGSTATASPGLLRKCPKAHPRWPWLYAAKILNIQGQGKAYKTTGNALSEANPMVFYATYDRSIVMIGFEPRPYYVLPDSQIPTGTLTWYDFDGTPKTSAYAQEWLRFTDFQVFPKPEMVTSQYGRMAFYTASGASPGGTDPSKAVTFPGFLRMVVPQAEIKMIWYQVPYSYMESANSRLVSYVGCVNQTDWWRWKAGELLYTGCTARKYSPPSPERVTDPETVNVAVSTPPKLCDVEMTFLFTRRTGTDVPSPPNRNWVAAGHNLMPWLKTRSFYYVAGGGKSDNLATSPPTFLSREFALLFSNPDS